MNQQAQHAKRDQTPPPDRLPLALFELLPCAQAYIQRKRRIGPPLGRLDAKNRFHLEQTFACCKDIPMPSKESPKSHLKHGRSLIHAAHEFGFEGRMPELTILAKALEQEDLRMVQDLCIAAVKRQIELENEELRAKATASP